MKKIIAFLLAIAILSIFALSSPASASVAALTVKSNIAMSDNADDPTVNDSTQSVTLEFSEPLNFSTIAGNVKLYMVKAAGEQAEVPSVKNFDRNAPTLLTIARKDGTKFTAGDVYKITVGGRVKSVNGASLEKEFAGYFAVNYSLKLDGEGIAELNKKRSLIICVSDIHLGADNAYSEFYRNEKAFADLMGRIRQSPDVKELVIAGDLVDEWFVPARVDTFRGKDQADFVKRVAAAHKPSIDALNAIIRDGKIKVTYVPGNHDILITAEDIESILPGISQARDVRGLGVYSPADRPEIAVEHGHRYNYFCAPDPISNRSITGTDSILPPGYFFTRIATASIVEKRPPAGYVIPPVTDNRLSDSQTMLYLYYQSFKDVLTNLPVREKFDEKFIKTNIDGYTADYSLSDVFPFQSVPNGPIEVKLYAGAQDTWEQRQKANLVPVMIPGRTAIANAAFSTDLDEKSESQYFKNPASNKRIVVFGHTHVPLVKASTNTKSQKTIYANSGTWIDHNPAGPTMDFVVITLPKSGDAAAGFVNLYKYSNEGTITRFSESQAITGLNQK